MHDLEYELRKTAECLRSLMECITERFGELDDPAYRWANARLICVAEVLEELAADEDEETDDE